jgi:hypothetical protein
MKKAIVILLVCFVLGALPAYSQYRFAATVNPLPAAGFFFSGYGIGASFEASLFRIGHALPGNVALKGYFSVMNLDMAELTDSETFSSMDTQLFTLGLSARYYFSRHLGGVFGGLQIKYISSSMENTFISVSSPYQPRTVKAEFNDILLGPELGYKFILPLNSALALYIEPSAGYRFTINIGGNYDSPPSRESYRGNIPSKYRGYADWVFGKGFYAVLSVGLAF